VLDAIFSPYLFQNGTHDSDQKTHLLNHPTMGWFVIKGNKNFKIWYNKIMKSIELIVRIIIKRGRKILLCKCNQRDQGHYFLPGGHVEFGEYFIDTIFRELQEEIGLEKNQISNIKYKDFLENTYEEFGIKHQELNMIFTVDIDNNFEVKSKESHLEFEWVEISEIRNVSFLSKEMISKLDII